MSWANEATSPVPPSILPHVAGRFYTGFTEIAATTTLVEAANTLYAIPICVPQTNTYTKIGVEITVLGLGSVRLGIYNDGGGAPSTLVLDAGTVAITSAAFKQITISQSLTPGWYWLAGVFDIASTLRAIAQAGCGRYLGFTSGTDVTFHPGWSVAFTYAALPNPFTASGALMTGNVPRFMIGI